MLRILDRARTGWACGAAFDSNDDDCRTKIFNNKHHLIRLPLRKDHLTIIHRSGGE